MTTMDTMDEKRRRLDVTNRHTATRNAMAMEEDATHSDGEKTSVTTIV